MSTTTPNYGLTKPDGNDYYNISIFNNNADILDSQLKENADAVSAASIAAAAAQNAAEAAATNSISLTEKGAFNGVAELDENGRVPSTQLPSYVDDVLEYDTSAGFPSTGESAKIYVALDTNLAYRWSGSAYIEISPGVALGETSSTAYRGDRGKTAYEHSQKTGNPHGVTLTDIGAAIYLSGTGTLPVGTSWSGPDTEGYYYYALTATGVTDYDEVDVTRVLDMTDMDASDTIQEAWNLIVDCAPGADTLTFYAAEQTAVVIPISWKLVR